MAILHPDFEEFSGEKCDSRAMATTLVNLATMTLNEYPDHPTRDKVMESMEAGGFMGCRCVCRAPLCLTPLRQHKHFRYNQTANPVPSFFPGFPNLA